MIRFYLSNEEIQYAQCLSDLSAKLFGRQSYLRDGKHKVGDSCRRAKMDSKYVHNFLKNILTFTNDKSHTVKINRSILKKGKESLKGIVSGMIATDGSVYCGKYGVHINFSTISKTLARQYSRILKLFGVEHSIYKNPRKGLERLVYRIIAILESNPTLRPLMSF